jgi:hypothetical protein
MAGSSAMPWGRAERASRSASVWGSNTSICPKKCPALRLSPSIHNYKLLILKVPEAGLEPANPFGRRILSPLRIPFRHSGGDRRSAADMVISDQSIA